MSTTTITFNLTVNAVPTNATTVTLSDSTNTFGARRTDTNATVVAAGTALNNTATGVYSYSFTDPAPGLTYEYWVTYVLNGNTYRTQQFVNGPISSPEPATLTLSSDHYAQVMDELRLSGSTDPILPGIVAEAIYSLQQFKCKTLVPQGSVTDPTTQTTLSPLESSVHHHLRSVAVRRHQRWLAVCS